MTFIALQQQQHEARQLLLAKQFAQALPRYEKLTRQCPGEAVVWFEYGNTASGLHDAKLADRAWVKAMELAPRDTELLGMIGHQYQGMRQPEKARDCFARAAAVAPMLSTAQVPAARTRSCCWLPRSAVIISPLAS